LSLIRIPELTNATFFISIPAKQLADMKTQLKRNNELFMTGFSRVVNTGTCCLQDHFDSKQTINVFYYMLMVFVFMYTRFSYS